MKPLVSIIIPTKNSKKYLNECLNSCRKQTYKNIEIIVVDNNSNDGTKKIARKYTSSVFNKGPERSAQKNFGAQKAHGKYLLFIDSDMTLSSSLIEKSIQTITHDKTVYALYINEKIPSSCILDFEKSFFGNTPLEAVRFIRKTAFQKAGGFDEDLTAGEDWDLDKRIRQIGKTGRVEKAFLYHHQNLLSQLKKKNRYSKQIEKYLSKWGKNDQEVKKQTGFSYRYFIVFTENGKWKKLIKNPFLSFCLYLYKITQGLIYLFK